MPRELLLRLNGPWGGSPLGPEAGPHRHWVAGAGKHEAEDLVIQRMAPRIELTDEEWQSDAILAAPLPKREILVRLPPLRDVDPGPPEVVRMLGNKRNVPNLPRDEYWPRFERIALTHLLAYEQGV